MFAGVISFPSSRSIILDTRRHLERRREEKEKTEAYVVRKAYLLAQVVVKRPNANSRSRKIHSPERKSLTKAQHPSTDVLFNIHSRS